MSAATTSISSPPSKLHRFLRYGLIALGAFAVVLVLFYGEEYWRGHRAWLECKRDLEANGADLDWAHLIPPPVPENENIFGVPEMQKWFVGRGWTEFSTNLSYPGSNNLPRVVIAQLTVGLPGTQPPSGPAVLLWDRADDQATAGQLMKGAIGPAVYDPAGFALTLEKADVHSAQIFLECEKKPDMKAINDFISQAANDHDLAGSDVKVDKTGDDSYDVTINEPKTVADYLAWGSRVQPILDLVSNAVQRPYARMGGDYSIPWEGPIPNFISARIVTQRVAALARCHFAVGEAAEALGNLTLIHEMCRILEGRPTGEPMTLVAAMIDVAVAGLYADTVEIGLQKKAWNDAQLAALEKQCQEVDLPRYVDHAIELERIAPCDCLVNSPVTEVMHNFFYGTKTNKLVDALWCVSLPRGWLYQNAVNVARLFRFAVAGFGPEQKQIFPDKLGKFADQVNRAAKHRTPYNFLATLTIPNFTRAFRILLKNQTKVNHAMMVCALERYRLAHGEYPEKLNDLIPAFASAIPTDLVGGNAPHYRRNGDGTFLLYSIGWDEKDHGGDPKLDLVWPEK